MTSAGISWLREVPKGSLVLNEKRHTARVAAAVWDRIDEYNCSRPTSPSVGRIYRIQKGRHCGGGPFNPENLIRIVASDPARPGWNLHHGFVVTLSDTGSSREEERP